MQNKFIIGFLIMLFFCVGFKLQAQDTLTLETAMQVALKNSPEILKSELSMTINQENLNARMAATKSQFALNISPFQYSQEQSYQSQWGKWFTDRNMSAGGSFIVSQPVVKTDGVLKLQNNFGYSDWQSTTMNGLTPVKLHGFGYTNKLFLMYSQPVFTYNKQKMEIEQLKRTLENSTLNYALQRMYLEQQVNRYFYNLYQIQMALKVAEDELKNQELSYEIIKSKVEGGLSAKEQLLQAELNLAQSQSGLKNKQVELENARDQFKQYLGIPLKEEINIQTNVEYKPVEIFLEKAIQNGLETRLELQQRQIDIKNSLDNLEVAKATNDFNGNIDLSFGYQGQNQQLTRLYSEPTQSPNVGITFSIPIWDWGQRKSRIKAAEANIKIQEINLNDQHTNIEIGIRQSFRSLQNLVLQIDIAKQSEKNAQLTYDINLERYRNGDLTSMDLGRFQNQLSTSKMNLVNSLINYKLELLNLKIQSLWDFESNTSFVPTDLKNNVNTQNFK